MIVFYVCIFLFGRITLLMVKGGDLKCNEYKSTDGGYIADCSRTDARLNVPDFLNTNTEVLDLSFNLLYNVTSTSFKRYKKLLYLDFSYMVRTEDFIRFDETCFVPLEKLVYLDLSGTCFPPTSRLHFPPTLTVLKLNHCAELASLKLNLTGIQGLVEFQAESSFLEKFPILDESSPLKFIVLSDNNLTYMTAEDLAPFCFLEQISFSIEDRKGIQSEKQYCHCIQVRRWLIYANVDADRLNCSEPVGSTPSEILNIPLFGCESALDEKLLSIRQKCVDRFVERNPPFLKDAWWRLLVVVIMVVLCVSIPVSFFIRRRWKKNAEKNESLERTENMENDQESTYEEDEEFP